MSKKTNPIPAAKKLLEDSGYTVIKKRPDPKIGDVIRFATDNGDDYDVLITFHQTTPNNDEDVWDFGGVEVMQAPYSHMDSESKWIDRNEWAKDDGQYTVVGHVDLTKYIKVIPVQ